MWAWRRAISAASNFHKWRQLGLWLRHIKQVVTVHLVHPIMWEIIHSEIFRHLAPGKVLMPDVNFLLTTNCIVALHHLLCCCMLQDGSRFYTLILSVSALRVNWCYCLTSYLYEVKWFAADFWQLHNILGWAFWLKTFFFPRFDRVRIIAIGVEYKCSVPVSICKIMSSSSTQSKIFALILLAVCLIITSYCRCLITST